jgi:hypothetical protein
MRRRIPGTILFVICLVLLLTASNAMARKPIFLGVRVAPKVLPPGGGEITITIHVLYASACTIYYEGLGAPRTISCSSGHLTYHRHVHANTGIYPEIWGVHVEAYNGHFHARSNDADVEVPPSEQAVPHVPGIDACTAGPECDYGPIFDTFQTYGNTTTLGDCTFAAAADWEQIALHVTPEPEQIAYEFGAAGGTETGGLSRKAFLKYWIKDGIGGIEPTGFESFTTGPEDARNAVNDYGALIVELEFTEEDGFGTETVGAGNHELVLDGYTPEGPLVVTWGRTVQMTWEQWADEIVGMWAVETT